ncbi:radical SAM/SPASM domain-containing protein [Clostridium tyrobutyricum]|uniref:radical SAM/SPASM domain-containing protein n=1 Tax=Clostridium tyrobutyricum TaxID=1519 RepID=UPI0010C34466|nr:radical SAM protein [Clostridium tyrobutyricum]QCH26948.1 Antilisterial bacteriocin subtilosin [Clostridium tyrobutyricum]
MEKYFSINDVIEVPEKLYIKKLDNKFVVLAFEKPNWIVLDEKEYNMFSLINKENTIIDILEQYSENYDDQEEVIIDCMQSLLEKVEKNKFYELTNTVENDSIEQIKKTIQIHLTHKCNMRCIHCYMAAGNAIDNELIEEEWKRTVDNLSKVIKNTEIVFTGGEPLIRKDSINIMKFAKKCGHNVVLFTNGVLIDEDIILGLSKCVDEIQVSIEGVTKQCYENVRGKDNYDKLINGLNLIKKYKIPLTLAITIIPSNIEDIEYNLINFLKKFDYDKVKVRINTKLDKEGYAKNLPEEFFENSNHINDRVVNIRAKLVEMGYFNEKKYQKNIHFYNCGIGCSITIDSNGKIYPCSKLNISRGNIVNKNINELIDEFNRLNRDTEITNMELCKECELKYICSGGCRIEHYLKTKNYLKPICDNNYKEQIYKTLINESL